MKQKATLILLGIVIILGMSLSIFMGIHQKEIAETVTKSEPTPTVTEQPTATPTPQVTSEPNVSATPAETTGTAPAATGSSIYQEPSNEGKHAITEQAASVIIKEAKAYYRNFEFLNGDTYLREKLATIANEGAGAAVYQLQLEGTYLGNIYAAMDEFASDEESADLDGVRNMLLAFEDPENAVEGMLIADYRLRERVLMDINSLNPIFEGNIYVTKSVELTPEEDVERILEQIKVTKPTAEKLYRVNFEIEGNAMYAYVIGFTDKHTQVFSFRAKGEVHYLTIAERKALYDQMNIKEGE